MTVASFELRSHVVFRERGVGEALDLAARFVFVHKRTYAVVSLFVLTPALAIVVAAGAWLGWAVAWAFVVPLAVLSEGPFTLLASRLVFHDEVSVSGVLSAAARQAPRIMLARVVTVLVVLIGLCFVLVPGAWIASALVFLPEVIIVERAKLGAALGRATRLAASRVGDTLSLLALRLLGFVAFAALADHLGHVVLSEVLQVRPPESLMDAGGSVLAAIGVILATPYVATARFFIYLNVRTAAEGWDIQTRFAEIARRADRAASDASPEAPPITTEAA